MENFFVQGIPQQQARIIVKLKNVTDVWNGHVPQPNSNQLHRLAQLSTHSTATSQSGPPVLEPSTSGSQTGGDEAGEADGNDDNDEGGMEEVNTYAWHGYLAALGPNRKVKELIGAMTILLKSLTIRRRSTC